MVLVVMTAGSHKGDRQRSRSKGGRYLLGPAVRSHSPLLFRRRKWHRGHRRVPAGRAGGVPLAAAATGTHWQAAPEEKMGQQDENEKRHVAKEKEEGQPAAAEAPVAAAAPAGAAV